MTNKGSSEKPFDFENAVVGQPGPDGSPVLRTFTTNGIPGVETRSDEGYRRLHFPLSALRRQPLVRMTPPPKKEVPKRRPARVARMLAMANDLQDKLDCGEYKDQAAAAHALGFTRTKLTRLLDLALLAPDIQEEVLFMEAVNGKEPITERALREVVRHLSWAEQRRVWQKLNRKRELPPGRSL